jgi:hypothetical protein
MLKANAELVYDAALEQLTGTIPGNRPFNMKAYSGGGRGHAVHVSPTLAKKYLHSQGTALSSRMATTHEITDDDGMYVQRGGTLPPGHYNCHYVEHHHTFHECIQLLTLGDALAIHSPFSPRPIPHKRKKDDFFIHGSGPKGSDGCIVPADDAERHRLNRAVKQFKGKVVLQVKNVSYILPAELEGQLA